MQGACAQQCSLIKSHTGCAKGNEGPLFREPKQTADSTMWRLQGLMPGMHPALVRQQMQPPNTGASGDPALPLYVSNGVCS
jgi:hypothetical protein